MEFKEHIMRIIFIDLFFIIGFNKTLLLIKSKKNLTLFVIKFKFVEFNSFGIILLIVFE